MTRLDFFNSCSPAFADILLLIDEQPTNLYEFLHYHLVEEDDECGASIDECKDLISLEPGESIYIGIVEIKRTK